MHTGDSPKRVKSKRRKRREMREKDRKLEITMAKLRMAHASTLGARKPPGPKNVGLCPVFLDGEIVTMAMKYNSCEHKLLNKSNCDHKFLNQSITISF